MTTTDQTTTGPLIDWEPGTIYPVHMVAHLSDGTTIQTPQQIGVWEYQPIDGQEAHETITLMVPDRTGHLTPSGQPMEAIFRDGEWEVSEALRFVMDPDRQRSMYTPLDPAANSADILAGTYRRDLGQDRRLTASEAARQGGVALRTFSAYVARAQAPQPDGHFGRTPYWLQSTIDAWRPTE